jgi:hypothetical protein
MADWREGLPDDLKSDPSIQKFENVEALGKSYIELQKTMGNSIRPPGPDASPEVKKEFFANFSKRYPGEVVYAKDEDALLAAMGKPEKPEDYAPSKELGELPSDLVENWRKTSVTLGLTKKQAENALRALQNEYNGNQQKIEGAKAELRKEWGATLEDRIKLSAEAAERLGFPPAVVDVIKSGKGAAAEMKAFYKAAENLGLTKPQNNMHQDGPGAQNTSITPGEALQRIAEIRKREEYWKPNLNPELHNFLKNEVVRLTGLAHPE